MPAHLVAALGRGVEAGKPGKVFRFGVEGSRALGFGLGDVDMGMVEKGREVRGVGL